MGPDESHPPPPPGWKGEWPPDPGRMPSASLRSMIMAAAAGLVLGLVATTVLGGFLRFMESLNPHGRSSIARMLFENDPRISAVTNGALIGMAASLMMSWVSLRRRLGTHLIAFFTSLIGVCAIFFIWSLGYVPFGIGEVPILPFLSPGDIPKHEFARTLGD